MDKAQPRSLNNLVCSEDSEEDMTAAEQGRPLGFSTASMNNNVPVDGISECTDSREFSPSVPIVSVTPYSPILTTCGKQYAVLEDNLRQLHDIVNSVQQMKDTNAYASLMSNHILGPNDAHLRLSCSCPTLNEPDSDSDVQTSFNSSSSYRDNSLTFSRRQRNSCDWITRPGISNLLSSDEGLRRKSWSALEDLSVQCGLDRKMKKQRSVSLSSFESDEADDPFSDSSANLLGVTDTKIPSVPSLLDRQRKSTASRRRTCRHPIGSTISTRSLNEADLQRDFTKIQAVRNKQTVLLHPRLPLQKSMSTPSILEVKDASLVTETVATKVDNSGSVFCGPPPSPPAFSCSAEVETEEEILASLLEATSDRNNYIPSRSSLMSYFHENTDSRGNSREKRQKRGSLFFRKKKDIPGKITAGFKKHSVRSSGSFRANVNSFVGLEKREDQCHDLFNYSDVTPLIPLDFLDEGQVTVSDLETDPFLGLEDEEPETWSLTVNKELIKKLKEKEVKRQEHIYELIQSEKHHCLTLRVMQKIFVEGFQKYFNLGINLNHMFPRLLDLTDIHLKFLYLLRERQREAPVVQNIGDILLEQFSGESAEKLKSAYGEFCSKHRDAVNIYKHYLQHDSRFALFVKHCQTNPLLKKKGIPECILFVTQRLTKYPLLIEPLIKTSKENKTELDVLTKALAVVKDVLVTVDAKVEEKEKEEKKLEIYDKIESKSFTYFRGKKFKKTAILSNSRTLQYEGTATLMHCRTKMQLVNVIVLSDVLFFLTENNSKLSFFTPYGKEGVISLQKLLVREKAGSDTRSIYLISSSMPNPEMYELKIHRPKDKQIWIKRIRDAIRNCSIDHNDPYYQSSNEKQQCVDEHQLHIQHITDGLCQKDLEQAIILEEKMSLLLKLLASGGAKAPIELPLYSNLLSEQMDNVSINKEVIYTLHRVQELTSSFYGSEVNLSRSASSVGERQSTTYISPVLPKRAETFGGFDNSSKNQTPTRSGAMRKLSQQLTRKSSDSSSQPNTADLPRKKATIANFLEDQQISWKNVLNKMGANFSNSTSNVVSSNQSANDSALSLLQIDKDAQPTIVELTSHIYTLAMLIMKQMTSIDAIESRLRAHKEYCEKFPNEGGIKKEKKQLYNHSQQLDELRNLQDKLTQEKEDWQKQKDAEEKDLEEKRQLLLRLQEQARKEQNDITLQREQLYRKLELLNSQCMVGSSGDGTNSPSSIIPISPITSPDFPSSSIDASKRRSDSMRWNKQIPNKTSTLPLNLISATNQQKVSSNVPIKQQLPLKLATKFGATEVSSTSAGSGQILPLKLQQTSEPKHSSGYQKLSTEFSTHSRTGSSPAMMQNTEGSNSDTEETDKRGLKTLDKHRVQTTPESKNAKPSTTEEEKVIFF